MQLLQRNSSWQECHGAVQRQVSGLVALPVSHWPPAPPMANACSFYTPRAAALYQWNIRCAFCNTATLILLSALSRTLHVPAQPAAPRCPWPRAVRSSEGSWKSSRGLPGSLALCPAFRASPASWLLDGQLQRDSCLQSAVR